MDKKKMNGLRMVRQCLQVPPNEVADYEALYRDLQPGQNVYWNGFGEKLPIKRYMGVALD